MSKANIKYTTALYNSKKAIISFMRKKLRVYKNVTPSSRRRYRRATGLMK